MFSFDWCCRQEVEELRYEQERLRWQLNQATHLGAANLPVQMPVAQAPALASNYCCHAGNDRYIVAKHTAIYPTTEDVSLITTLYCYKAVYCVVCS